MLYKSLLLVHIVLGFYSLGIVPIVLMFKLGSKQHKSWGKTFFYAMLAVAVSALGLTLLKFNFFLMTLGVFTVYMVLSGYRAIYTKKLHLGEKPKWTDWSIAIATALFGLVLLGYGFSIWGEGSFFLALIFGALSFLSAMGNVRIFLIPPTDPKHWVYRHISGMFGAYIATWSAFSATNMDFLPTLWQWTWPTILGSILIAFYIRREKGKKAKIKPADIGSD